MKIIKIMDNITVVLNSGEILSSDNCTDEMFKSIYNNQNDEDFVKSILIPEFATKVAIAEQRKDFITNAKNSKYLTVKGSSVYLLNISELSIPEDLVDAILLAEKEENEDLLQTYFNFWTLVSLNPDSRCRQNLFWFLNKYGMTISKSGLFVAYRNVNIKKIGSDIEPEFANFISSEYTRIKFVNKKSPKNYCVYKENSKYVTKKCDMSGDNGVGNLDDLYKKLSDVDVATIYTDQYTKKFEIKLGEVVTMPRTDCDLVQENSCSKGLHVAGKTWLKENYFGEVGLMVLVNPADVVAVPPIDDYGKMRTCAYYPVSVVEFDDNGDIIDMGIEDGFEDDFIDKICYSGKKNNNDSNPYYLNIPDIPELDKSKINDRLLNIVSGIKKLV